MEKTIAYSFYESYNQKDLDKSFDAYIAKDLINHAMGGVFDREKWKAFDQSFLTAVSDFKMTIVQQVAEGERIATQYIMEGKHSGTFIGMPASGNAIRLEVISMDVIKGGKIAEHNSIGDFTAFMQQFAKK